MFSNQRSHHPHMRTKESRLGTYYYGSTRWSQNGNRAQPHVLAEAGLFYIGERDKVKCWYCNGGLENWEVDDDPWTEHAKWYPECEFLLQRTSPEFVQRVQAENRVPLVASRDNAAPRHQQTPSSSFNTSFATTNPPVERTANVENIETRITSFMESSLLVQLVQQMGFSAGQILEAVTLKFETSNRPFDSVEELLEVIVPVQNYSRSQSRAAASSQHDDEACELRRLEERRSCKQCRQEPARTVFLPCGHLCCCTTCSGRCRDCPMCGVFISEKIQSFIC